VARSAKEPKPYLLRGEQFQPEALARDIAALYCWLYFDLPA